MSIAQLLMNRKFCLKHKSSTYYGIEEKISLEALLRMAITTKIHQRFDVDTVASPSAGSGGIFSPAVEISHRWLLFEK